MNYLPTFYHSLLAVLIIIALGFALGKSKIINQAASKVMTQLLLLVAMPCALFSAFPQQFSRETWHNFLFATFAGAAVLFSGMLIAKALYQRRFLGKVYRLHQFAYIFNNASFLGYPLVVAVFGQNPHSLIYYSGLMLAFNFSLFSYGVYLVKHQFTPTDAWQLITNPNIVAVCLGLLCFRASLPMPEFVLTTINALKNLTTPLSLLVIGFFLSQMKNFSQTSKLKKLTTSCLMQLIIMPSTTFLILKLLGADNLMVLIFTLIQALPTATSLAIFSENYGGDKQEASALVLMSTLLSFITLPVVMTVAIYLTELF